MTLHDVASTSGAVDPYLWFILWPQTRSSFPNSGTDVLGGYFFHEVRSELHGCEKTARDCLFRLTAAMLLLVFYFSAICVPVYSYRVM